LLIGLGHSARVGKDTCAALLVEHHGYERLAFADALRDFVDATHADISHLVDRHGWDYSKETFPFVRQTLVDVGNAARQIMGEDVWVDAAFSRMTSPRTVVTDVRYPNEVDAIRRRGGLAVKVTRPGVCPLPNVADQALAGYDGWDAVIVNDGDLDDLFAQLDCLVA